MLDTAVAHDGCADGGDTDCFEAAMADDAAAQVGVLSYKQGRKSLPRERLRPATPRLRPPARPPSQRDRSLRSRCAAPVATRSRSHPTAAWAATILCGAHLAGGTTSRLFFVLRLRERAEASQFSERWPVCALHASANGQTPASRQSVSLPTLGHFHICAPGLPARDARRRTNLGGQLLHNMPNLWSPSSGSDEECGETVRHAV